MKAPSQCPYCKRNLVNEYIPGPQGTSHWRKSCTHIPNHSITIYTDPGNDDEIGTLFIRVKIGLLISWNFTKKECKLLKSLEPLSDLNLPFFEPDLSNYTKLIEKIKIYILFS